ncbi:MAG: hypothetical protein R3Y38_05240, partial [Rikenellaceae bacterium]
KETDGSYMADSIFVKASASLENTNLMFSFNDTGYNSSLKTTKIESWSASNIYTYSYENSEEVDVDVDVDAYETYEFDYKFVTSDEHDAIVSAIEASSSENIEIYLPNAYELDNTGFISNSKVKSLRFSRMHNFDPALIANSSITLLDLSGVAFYTEDSFASFTNSESCDLRINVNKWEGFEDGFVENVWASATWKSITYIDHQGNEIDPNTHSLYFADLTSNFTLPDNSTLIILDSYGTSVSSPHATQLNASATGLNVEIAVLKALVNAQTGINLIFPNIYAKVYGSTFSSWTGMQSLSARGFVSLQSGNALNGNSSVTSYYLPNVVFGLKYSIRYNTKLTDAAFNSVDLQRANANGLFLSGCSSLEFLDLPSTKFSGYISDLAGLTSLLRLKCTADSFFFDDTYDSFGTTTPISQVTLILGANSAVTVNGNVALGDEGAEYTFAEIRVLSE